MTASRSPKDLILAIPTRTQSLVAHTLPLSPPSGGLLDDNFKKLGSTIGQPNLDARIDFYLAQNFPFFTRSIWQKRIELGEILLNGKKTRPSQRLHVGDQIYMYHPEHVEPEVSGTLDVCFQDGGVLCVTKPAGLPMHEGGAFRKRTFANLLAKNFGTEWSAVHRLDKETSGLVLCGASDKIRRKLSHQLRDGSIRKEYLAIVNGAPSRDEWAVDAPIGRKSDSAIRIKNWVVSDPRDGQSALTEFSVEQRGAHASMVRAFPRTGRTNQIRIHAAYVGHHLVGDKLFHPDEDVFLEYFENGTTEKIIERVGHSRCCLHAARLSFLHPENNQYFSVEAELASDMREVWEKLRGGLT